MTRMLRTLVMAALFFTAPIVLRAAETGLLSAALIVLQVGQEREDAWMLAGAAKTLASVDRVTPLTITPVFGIRQNDSGLTWLTNEARFLARGDMGLLSYLDRLDIERDDLILVYLDGAETAQIISDTGPVRVVLTPGQRLSITQTRLTSGQTELRIDNPRRSTTPILIMAN